MAKPVSARKDAANLIVSVGPDVCLTPMGSSMVPVAYNSVAFLGGSVRTSPSVLNNGNEDFQINTRSSEIVGHEAGTGKGVVVAGYKTYSTIRKGSSSVYSEGWQVVRNGDPAWINRPDPGPVETRRSKGSRTVDHQ